MFLLDVVDRDVDRGLCCRLSISAVMSQEKL